MLIFGLQQLLPGDPAMILAGEDQDPALIAHLRAKLHLDEPLPVRYAYWIGGVLRGDLGESVRTQQPVLDLIVQKLPVTIELALLAMAVALLIGIPAGIVAAVGRDTPWDYGATVFALSGLSMPNFWLGILMILLFSVQLGWTPVSGRIDVRYFVEPVTGFLTIDTLLSGEKGAFRSALSHLVLPMIVLGTVPLAIIARMTRSSMLEVLGEDYIRTARAKGLSRFRVIGLHAFRNALIPVVTVIGLQVGVLFTGAILTETIFSWPGVGKWMIEAINRRDYPVLQGGLLLLGTVVMAVNLLVDVAYGVINPRIRRG